jgi:hypothetical protein
MTHRADRLPARPRRASLQVPALLLVLAFCTASCGDETAPAGCQAGAVLISVSSSLTPEITWTADCGAQVVAVYETATGLTMWQLEALTRGIPKPVTYGRVPLGSKESQPAEDLQPGTTYGVYVALLVGSDTLAGIVTFTP